MELRAREDTLLAQDLIPAIPPIAASLHHRFLRSHCSACLRPLLPNSQNTPPSPNSCTVCNSSVSYCSPNCYTSDIGLHSSSGECHLFRLLDQSPPSTCHPAEPSDVRAGLRLLETLGPLGSSSPRRICGLSLTDLDAVLSEGSGSGSEMAERIRQGAALMRRARKEKGAREEEVLWAVLTNAVEVQVSEGGALGIAVYGPWFSWFNHSCSPNACYRFELASSSRSESVDFSDLGLFRVLPTSNGEVPEVIAINMVQEL